MQHHHDEDSQEITRLTNRHHEILTLKQRRQNHGHCAYGGVALAIGGTALLVWGFILRDAYFEPPNPATRGYIAFLAAAIVLGISGSAAAFTWMIVRVIQRLTAEQDLINDYETEQRAKRDALHIEQTAQRVIDLMRDAERNKRQSFWEEQAAEMRRATGTGPTPRRAPDVAPQVPPEGSPSPVLQFPPQRSRN